MYRRDAFDIEAVIGMVKSTNHRFRMITVFKRREEAGGQDTVPRLDRAAE
jgi:hypothetical protein